MLKPSDVRRPQGRNGYTGPLYPHQFLVPPPSGSTQLVFLSPKFESYEIHWYGKMHHICTAPTGMCDGCRRGTPVKPLCYGFALVEGTTRIGVLKLTPRMIDAEPALGRLQRARGVQARYYRYKNCPQGRACIEVQGEVFDPSTLPPAPDIEAFLLKMFSKLAVHDARDD